MQKSTALFKSKRIKGFEKNKLRNLINHYFRNYKPDTEQYKKDYFPDETKNNLLINPDFSFVEKNDDWSNEVEKYSAKIFNTSQEVFENLNNISDEKNKDSLSTKERELIIKSITYVSKINEGKLTDEELKFVELKNQAINFKNDKKKNYDNFDNDLIKEAYDFYSNPPKDIKIASLSAKRKNFEKLLNVADMGKNKVRNEAANVKSVFAEDVLFKLPRHNDKAIKDTHMIEIVQTWQDQHFSDYSVICGVLHKDERTRKGKPTDDHLHILRSGLSSKTNRFDLPDYTFKLGLDFAKKQGKDFKYDGQKWSKAGEILRELSGEAIQEEFYKHANSILEKYDYNFRLGIKEKTEEEKQLREKIKAEADLPKSKRSHNLYTYFEDEAKKQIESKNKEFRNFQKLAEKGNLYKEKIGLLKNRGNELKEYISEKQNENKILTDEIKNKQKEIQHLDQKILLSKKDISQKNDELEVINKELQFKKTMNKDLSLIDKFKIKMFDYVISVKNYFDTKLDFKLKGILSDSFDLFNYCNDDEKEKIKEIAEYTENKAINNIEDLPSNLRITQVLKSGNVGNDDITDPVKNKNSHKFKR
ncbi:hypothetical protein KW426_21695 [Vibrio fluvialis]|nr:hypothetical protein [Vibrio fluvialis]MBY7775710.1 hypothetical protein [Vibrio fluvialis]MBY7780080.1 hypothetical protein [Vibrio fluvialis]MBY7989342.1 hypothetical protein [Vibrio fluvialis]MBY7993640.1 hypothetical protein [Vibrio fluvialis]